MHAITFCAPLPYRPGHEAISKEISLLMAAADTATVVTVPPFKNPPWQTHDQDVRVIHPVRLLWPVTARQALRGSGIIHVFTPLPLPRRISLLLKNHAGPTMVTVISHGGLAPTDREILGHVRFVVAECERDYNRLLADGFPAKQLRLIVPATGLEARLLPVPEKVFTILFASSPLQPAEMAQRGVDLLTEAARRCPAVNFHLLWRPGAEDCLAMLPDLPNLIIDRTLYADITRAMGQAHAVVAPFRAGGKAKSVPLSIIEALQCGLPVLVSDAVGVADMVDKQGCGIVFEPEVDHLVTAIRLLKNDFDSYRAAVVPVANRFEAQEFCQRYAVLIAEFRDH